MYKIYVIKEGDTLEIIADKFNTSIEVLQKINDNLMYSNVGSPIIVPNTENIPFLIYTVKKGDNVFEIAKKYNVNYKDILAINGLKEGEYIYPNQDLLIPRPNTGIYLVKEGETLTNVSNNLGLTQKEIIESNASIYLLPEQIILYKKEKRS